MSSKRPRKEEATPAAAHLDDLKRRVDALNTDTATMANLASIHLDALTQLRSQMEHLVTVNGLLKAELGALAHKQSKDQDRIIKLEAWMKAVCDREAETLQWAREEEKREQLSAANDES